MPLSRLLKCEQIQTPRPEMEKQAETKRVFLAFEVHSPWPKILPQGRILKEEARHLTIAFIGDIHYASLENILNSFPPPKILVGMSGKFDHCLFLPKKKPNVVSWHIEWDDHHFDLAIYKQELINWLTEHQIPIKHYNEIFLPHVTLSRRPFQFHEWRKAFQVLPLYIKDIHLYESKSGLNYTPLWTWPLLAPFEVIKVHEGLILSIRGEKLTSLFKHCISAIAFFYPSILSKNSSPMQFQHFGELFPFLEKILKKAREKDPKLPTRLFEIGAPALKEDHLLTWEIRIQS